MIKCELCGHENPLGHLYCMKCHAKLHLKTHADAEMLGTSDAGRRWTKQAIIGAALAIVALLVGLSLWPETVNPSMGGSEDFRSACRKINRLESKSSAGVEVFTEDEINAYMPAVVARARTSAGADFAESRLRSVSLSPRNGAVELRVCKVVGPLVIGPLQFGPWESTYTLVGVPESGKAGFQFRVKYGRRGHLPLPAFFVRSALAETTEFFSGLAMEKQFLDRTGNIEVMDGRVSISMKP